MIALWILLILVAIAAVQLLIWIPISIWLRRRSAAHKAALVDEITAAGETLKRGPESALYRGSAFGYSQVSGNGVILLTDRRVLFQKVTGGRIDVPLDHVAEVREDKVFLGAYRSGRLNLILRLKNGDEVGFILSDHPAWMAAIREAVGE